MRVFALALLLIAALASQAAAQGADHRRPDDEIHRQPGLKSGLEHRLGLGNTRLGRRRVVDIGARALSSSGSAGVPPAFWHRAEHSLPTAFARLTTANLAVGPQVRL